MDASGAATAVARVVQEVARAEFAEFPAAATAALAEVIPSTFIGYYEVEPVTQHLEVTVHPETEGYPPELRARLATQLAEHPLAAHHYATGYEGAMRISDLVSQEDYHRTRIYREVHGPMHLEYQMTFRLPGSEPMRIVIALSRSDHDFTDDERDLFDLLRLPLAAARARAARAALLHAALEHHVAAGSGGSLVALEGDRLVALDDRSDSFVARLRDHAGLPRPPLRAWFGVARAGDAALADPVPDRHVTTWDDDEGSLLIRHVTGLDGRDLLVVHPLATDLRTELRGLGLQPRQAEVLEAVMGGHDNRETAALLGITVGTVRKHLEGIYRVLGVTSRAAAAAAGFAALAGGPSPDRH